MNSGGAPTNCVSLLPFLLKPHQRGFSPKKRKEKEGRIPIYTRKTPTSGFAQPNRTPPPLSVGSGRRTGSSKVPRLSRRNRSSTAWASCWGSAPSLGFSATHRPDRRIPHRQDPLKFGSQRRVVPKKRLIPETVQETKGSRKSLQASAGGRFAGGFVGGTGPLM